MERPTGALWFCDYGATRKVCQRLHASSDQNHAECGWFVPWTPDADRGGFDELRAALAAYDARTPNEIIAGIDGAAVHAPVVAAVRSLLAAHPATGDGRRWLCAFNMGDVPACTPNDPHGGDACRFVVTRNHPTPPPATGERTEAGGDWVCSAAKGSCTAEDPHAGHGCGPAPASHDGSTSDEDGRYWRCARSQWSELRCTELAPHDERCRWEQTRPARPAGGGQDGGA